MPLARRPVDPTEFPDMVVGSSVESVGARRIQLKSLKKERLSGKEKATGKLPGTANARSKPRMTS